MKCYFYLKHFPSNADYFTAGEGTSKAVHGLASGFAACGAEVTILCEGSHNSLVQTSAGYKIACFANKTLKPSLAIAPSLEPFIRDHADGSIIILNGIFHLSVYTFSRILKKYSIPYIVAPHDPYHPNIFRTNAHLKWPYWYLLERPMLRQAKAVQVLDNRHAEWLHRLRIHTPVVEVPNGFSFSDVNSDSTLFWRTEGAPKLFFLGRLDAYNKGLDILLDTFAQLIKVSDCQLTIQGPDRGDRKELEQRAIRLGLWGKVTFLEPDYNLSPASIIANYDIVCVPSRFEGFSLSAMEAMLAGRVLLISEVAGIAPHIQASGCGIVVKPEVSSIKAGLLKLFQCRSKWKEMGLSGRQYVLENLHWQKIASRALEEYKCLIA